MSYFQGSPLVFPQSYNNLAFPVPNNNHMPYQPVSSLGSPNSTSDSSMNDLMSNFLAYEQMNNYRLMSMFKMSESPQSPNTYPPMMNPKWDIKTEAVHPVKMEQKSEPELEEIVVKKVKINTQGNYKQSSANEAMRLSSLVDQQMQKLPAWTRESVNRILAQNKQKMSAQSTITNTYKTTQLLKQNVRPLRILAFKYDRKLQDFMYLVEWKERADGMKPNNSFLSKGELLRIDPAMIIAYYEKQVANTFQNFLFEN